MGFQGNQITGDIHGKPRSVTVHCVWPGIKSMKRVSNSPQQEQWHR